MGTVSRKESRLRRKKRVRKRIRGTSERPRLCVFRSRRHIYAQVIDDSAGKTLAAASSVAQELADKIEGGTGSRGAASMVGAAIAERALSKGIRSVVFDRNGFLYHGRVKSLSDAARQNGLEF